MLCEQESSTVVDLLKALNKMEVDREIMQVMLPCAGANFYLSQGRKFFV